ncbi:MAG: lipoate--protein ligase family protein [Gemmataceae bacterium]
MALPSSCDTADAPRRGLPCRLVPTAVGYGAEHMATDEVMLEAAAAGRASLRFYLWSVPTLSLGYFQPHAPALAAIPGVPWVRRPSGGSALLHHVELTYALALPPGRDWQPPGSSWACRFHHIIRQTLEAFNVRGRLCDEEVKAPGVLCFQHHTPGDLIVAGHKVAGSAQRKSRGALLQHGGVLLMSSHHTPQLPGIIDLGGPPMLFDELPAALRAAFLASTGWRLEAEPLTDAERGRVAAVRAERYESDEWNRRR